jgi:hypothetical protein
MNLIPIKVECHSGYKSDEYPVRFTWRNIQFEISEIADRWYQSQPSPETPLANYFKVRTVGNLIFILKHELKSDLWFILSAGKATMGYSSN